MKRILYAGLTLLVGLVGGVVLNGWTRPTVDIAVALAAGYVLGAFAWARLEGVK